VHVLLSAAATGAIASHATHATTRADASAGLVPPSALLLALRDALRTAGAAQQAHGLLQGRDLRHAGQRLLLLLLLLLRNEQL